MIERENIPTIHDDKHFIDLNEKAYTSRWRLMAFFQRVAEKEVKLSRAQIKKAYSRMEKTRGVDPILPIIDEYIGSHVVFYWGVGDNDPADARRDTAPKTIKRTESNRFEPRETQFGSETSTQDTLSKNLRKHTKARKGKK